MGFWMSTFKQFHRENALSAFVLHSKVSLFDENPMMVQKSHMIFFFAGIFDDKQNE